MVKSKVFKVIMLEVFTLSIFLFGAAASELDKTLLKVAQDEWDKVESVSVNSYGTEAKIRVDFGKLPWTRGIAGVCDMCSGEVLEAIFKKSKPLKSLRKVTIKVFTTALDDYGNEKEFLIYTVIADRETVEKINFYNLGYVLSVRNILHPTYHSQIQPK